MRLDGVEVKVSLDSDQTAEAVRALDLAGEGFWPASGVSWEHPERSSWLPS